MFRSNIKHMVAIFFLFSCALLQGCSQASKTDEKSAPAPVSPIPAPPAPTSISLDDNVEAFELTEVKVQAKINNPDGIVEFFWRQTDASQIDIDILQSKELIFIAPSVPENETKYTITFDFIVIDSENNEIKDSISITINKFPPLPIAEAGENQTVFSLESVLLEGQYIIESQGIKETSWKQISGPTVSIPDTTNSQISFIAPEVNQTEIITLSFTVTDNLGQFHSDNVDITVNSVGPNIPEHVLLLTKERINKVKSKISKDNTAWLALKSKISNYFNKIPYNAGEYAAAFSLAYYVSGDDIYIKRAIELINHAYFSKADIGWEHYKSRNLFRVNARWAIMGYSWIKDFISESEQNRIENILTLWSKHWLNHVDYQNDFEALRIVDTDDVTSITKNLTLLGYVLSASDTHSELGKLLLETGDSLLERYVVNYYMNDIMEGGAWAEGSDYSPATQGHWIETFLINKEQRGIPFPTNYAKEALSALIHQTLSNNTGVYKYGSEEHAVDYDELAGDYRYEFALGLMSILDDEKDIALVNEWFNKIIDKYGFKSGSMVTHFDRLLFHDPTLSYNFKIADTSTFHFAEGVGLISSRDNWSDKATNLYFINRQLRVDHEHNDALSFDVAHNGTWVSKEATGYSGASATSAAHNTILIENAADGSSSPTRRPAGPPKYNYIFDDNKVTLISADATQTYNMSGYFATTYAKLVNRQMAFIKPNLVIVYDHIVTDEKQIKDLINYKDLGLADGMEHIRWVKLIQHIQTLPTVLENRPNSYLVESENQQLVYQVLLPNNAEIKIVDEKNIWQDALEYEMPDNQKKWHFEVTNNPPLPENEFITSLSFGESGTATVEQLLIDSIIMTKENGYIISDNVLGVAINSLQGKYILLFNREPSQIIENVQIKKPDGYEDALIYGLGFTVN